MKNIILLLAGVCLIALCCNSKKAEQYTVSPFSGNWISKNYIDSLDKNGTPALAGNVSCEELVINFSGDSACLINGGDEATVFKMENKNDKSFRIKKFNQDDYTEFTLSENKKELSYEYKKYKQKFSFRKTEPKYAVKMINGWPSALELFFNERVMAANYFLVNVDNKAGNVISFTSYSKIVGLPGFTDYLLCLGGDCMSMADGDMITLSDTKSSENFIWEWKNDTLIFSSASNIAKQDEKPHYIKGMEIFKFIKKL